MRARGFLLAAGLSLSAAPAAAQPRDFENADGRREAPSQPSPGAWTLYPRERHVLVRAEATAGFRLSDPFAFGALGPPGLLLHGSFAFLHLGPLLAGPSLGVQLGFDPQLTGVQSTVQPGFQVLWRPKAAFGLTARVEVPLLITRGACPVDTLLVPTDRQDWQGMGSPANRGRVTVPSTDYCPAVAPGVEVAVGAALYIRSGFALTAEVVSSTFFGNSGLVYPLIGGALGVMVDYEVLP